MRGVPCSRVGARLRQRRPERARAPRGTAYCVGCCAAEGLDSAQPYPARIMGSLAAPIALSPAPYCWGGGGLSKGPPAVAPAPVSRRPT
jgi:hypothetical protein